MRKWRTAAKIAVVGVLAFVAMLTAALAALQMRPVQHWLVATINRSLSGQAHLIAFSGTIPSDMRVGRIELFDPAGRWAVIHDAHLKVDPAALLRGRIGIDLLSSREIRVERRPQSSGSSSSSSLALPVELRRLDLSAIDLAPPVLGQEVVLSVSGNAKLAPGQTEAHFDLHRLDNGPGRLNAQLDLSGQPTRLRVAMNVDDPSGNLLDTLLARDDHLPLSARLSGDGLVTDWHGRLDATAGGTARIGADISLSEADGYRAAVEGRAEIAALLPASVRDLVGNATTFRLSGSRKPNGDIVADTLRLNLAAATLAGSAVVGAGADGPVKVNIAVEAPDLVKLSPLLGRASGSAEFRLAVSGTKLRPAARADLEAKALKLAGSGANDVVAHIEANPTGALSALHSRVNLSGKGEIRGIVASGAPLTGGDERLTWTLAGSVEPAKQAIAISRLDIDAPGATLIARGNADKARQTLAGTVHLAATDLSRLSGLAGRTLSGHGIVDATVSHEASGASQLGVTGKLDDLTTGIPAMDGLLGRKLDIDVSARRLANGDLDVPKTSIDAANFHAAGRATLATNTNRVAGAFTIDLPRLDVLSTPARPVSGHAHLDGTISGTAAAPQLTTLLDAGAVAFGGSRLDRLTARLDASEDPNPKGSLDAQFQSGSLSGTLNGTFALSGNGKALDLSSVNFTAGGTTASMALHTALDTRRTSGKIDARSSDLSRLSNLVGLPLSGTMRLETRLTAERGQGASFSFSGANLSLGSDPEARPAIKHVTAEGQVSDVFGKPQGRAELNMQGATVANTTIDHVRSSIASSRAGRFGFNADLVGRSNAPLELSAAGTVELAKDSVAARITRFEGKLSERAFRLDAPLRFASSGSDISVSDLNLALGDGRVTGDVTLKGERVRASLKAQDIPLALAEVFARQDTIAGMAGADLDIRGTVTHPTGHIAMTAQKLRLGGARANQPTVDITADARLLPGRVALDGRITMVKGEALEIAGEVPIRIRRQPFTAAVVRDRPLAMHINGNGRLEDIADLLPIGEDKLAGSYHVDLRLSGTAASPNAAGQMTLRNGRYESFVYGTVLDGMTLDVTGNRDRIVLQRFSANDGDKGTLNIRGTSLLSATVPTLDVTVALRKFRFMRNDEAVGHGSGDVRIAGNMTEPHVTGGIRLDDAQLYLPDRLPPSVRKLDVTEINGATGDVLEEAPPSSSKQPVVATLDVTLDIPGQVFVRGRGLDSEWQGRFHITGTSNAPQIEGGLQVVHGTMNFLGKTLTLSRGTITLVGGDKIEPMLDFLAESTSANITAQVAVTGSVQQPKITLTSNPPLPQDQILAQLLFGRDVTQLSPLEGAQIAQAAAALASGGPSVIDRVRMKFGLDRLSIGSGDQNTPGAGPSAPPSSGAGASASAGSGASSGVGNAAVSAGKYVAPGTYVGVKQSASGESQAQVEVEITRHVEVGATAGASRGNSVGVQWKLDY